MLSFTWPYDALLVEVRPLTPPDVCFWSTMLSVKSGCGTYPKSRFLTNFRFADNPLCDFARHLLELTPHVCQKLDTSRRVCKYHRS